MISNQPFRHSALDAGSPTQRALAWALQVFPAMTDTCPACGNDDDVETHSCASLHHVAGEIMIMPPLRGLRKEADITAVSCATLTYGYAHPTTAWLSEITIS